ncbi:MAG: tetratricopeptide repeat protein [Akkermansia sp.]|nr:tetratricopeptide repeat protein [Akkermansia sp.]
MKSFLRLGTGVFLGAGLLSAQEEIPSAEPVEDAPLVANPERDSMDMANMLYTQAQSAEIKANPVERKRLLELSYAKYQDVFQNFPNAAQAALAEYRAAMCLQELGRVDGAEFHFQRLAQTAPANIAAAAAYHLATDASAKNDVEQAIRYYQIVVQKAEQKELRIDAQYRLARLYLKAGDTNAASTLFCAIIGNKEADAKFVLPSRFGFADICAKSGRLGEAYKEYLTIINSPNLTPRNRVEALLQAGNLAIKLKKKDEASKLFEMLKKDDGLSAISPDAQIGVLVGLYGLERYEDVKSLFESWKNFKAPSRDSFVMLQMLMGQTYYHLKDYSKAATFFLEAERSVPHTQKAMQASYFRLMCYNELKQKDLPQRAQNFLNHYAVAFPTSELHDMVRLMVAESLFSTNPTDAARFYISINFDKLPAEMRPDILYKSAWAVAHAGNREAAAKLLTRFIDSFPADKRLCEALTLRGDMYARTKKEVEALADFDRVIKRWPNADSAAAAWQRAGQIYASRQDFPNMVRYYEGLIKNFPKASPSALSEAHYLLGRAYFDRDEYEKALSHLSEAKTLDGKKYGEQVNLLCVLCYHKAQNYDKLKMAVETLQNENPSAVSRVPDVIPAWLGLQAYGMKDLENADKYLTWATQNDQLKNVKKIIWRNLAKVRLALKKYDRALVASENFLKDEEQPYRRADGMLDKASILLGLGKYAEARKTAEQALALGVEGPLMASLKIVLGDISFAEKKYDEAAKFYGVTAELFVNDEELKPKALHRTAQALEKAGRKAEASQYRNRLQSEFPEWKPEESISNN